MVFTLKNGSLATLKHLATHWFLFLVVFGGICVAIAGGVGGTLGIPNLFRDDPDLSNYGWSAYRNSPAFLTQAAAISLLGVLWTFTVLLEASCNRRETLRFVLWRVMFFAIFPLASAVLEPFGDLPHPGAWELFRMIAGIALGVCLTVGFISLGYSVSSLLRWRQTPTFLAVFFVVISLLSVYHTLVPAVAIFAMLGWPVLAYVTLKLAPEPSRVVLVLLAVTLIVIGNGVPYKYRFGGFTLNAERSQSYYDQPVNLAKRQPLEETAKGNVLGPLGCLIDPVASLERWRAMTGVPKPKLIVVTTSGGAYRAAFWTALVLDALEHKSKQGDKLSGLTRNVRLITGASGGMVGAAYFVASPRDGTETLVERLTRDTIEGQRQTRYPIARDTLSPIAQRFAQQDIRSVFLPWSQDADRGVVLESQWRTLRKSYAELLPAERDGRIASLVLSPMLVETGQPLLISNLNLLDLPGVSEGEAVEFFRWFPRAHTSFGLQTAVRMNATFPYVSPAVALPTSPPRRVVDAGYYDNYGISVAVAYLRQPKLSEWIKVKTAGVMILQIHAYPMEDPRRETRFRRAFQWLTTPLEGVGAARQASMVFRNNQELRALDAIYPPEFVKTITFVNASAAASMSWYLPGRELESMRKQLDETHNARSMDALVSFWDSNEHSVADFSRPGSR